MVIGLGHRLGLYTCSVSRATVARERLLLAYQSVNSNRTTAFLEDRFPCPKEISPGGGEISVLIA